MKKFAPGEIKPLWSISYYDGPMTLVGQLADGQSVYLDAKENPGGWCQKPKWLELECLLDELLEAKDAESLWDRIERKYDDDIWENGETNGASWDNHRH